MSSQAEVGVVWTKPPWTLLLVSGVSPQKYSCIGKILKSTVCPKKVSPLNILQ